MERIETRTQLINFICERSGRSAIKRACHDATGKVVVLGGFSRILQYDYPGWIVVITSRFGKTWYAIVLGNTDTYEYDLYLKAEMNIPWGDYVGRRYNIPGECSTSIYSIYDGDMPIASDVKRRILQQSRKRSLQTNAPADTPSEDKAV